MLKIENHIGGESVERVPGKHSGNYNRETRKTGKRTRKLFALALIFAIFTATSAQTSMPKETRPRARETGLKIGVLPVGKLNAITDVAGVSVGHTTVIRGESVRTGVTAILPHGGNLFQEKVPGAVFVGNGFGKLSGSTQVDELGEIETPILLTSTLSVPRVGDFLLDYMLALPGNEAVQSINPLVAETNDGFLNDIRGRHISREDVFAAIKEASAGKVEEGSIGAGTGTVAFGFKGGIGTSSRKLPASLGGYTIGVLVQTNFGGVLTIDGAPVGVELGKYYLKDAVEAAQKNNSQTSQTQTDANDLADGSIIIVIATDAPVDARQLKRMAARAMMGLARTGAAGTNGSGDYAIAFSTAAETRLKAADANPRTVKLLSNDAMSPLFLAVIEATEEAIYNSLFRAATVTGREKRTVEALPIEKTLGILRKYGKIK
jgi:D-aminopeptidase